MKTKDQTQRIYSYTAGSGLTMYGTKEYNAHCNAWFIVGDVSENKDFIEAMIENHHLQLKLKRKLAQYIKQGGELMK